MTYTDLEIKFLRYALDTNSEGEAGNAAAMFFKELRKRGIKAYQFEDSGNSSVPSSSTSREVETLQRQLKESSQVARFLSEQWQKEMLKSSLEMGARNQAEQALAQCQKELANMQAKGKPKKFEEKPKQFSYWKTCDLFHAR